MVKPILPELLKKYKVIHQAGKRQETEFRNFKDTLKSKERYETYGFKDPEEIISDFSEADLIIARSGATTVSQVIAARRPVIFIPLPWNYLNEQTKNAQVAEKLRIAKIIYQKNLTSGLLLSEINEMIANLDNYLSNARKLKSPDYHASEKVIDLIKSLL